MYVNEECKDVVVKVWQNINWVSGRRIYKIYKVYTVYLSLIRKVPITIYKHSNIQLCYYVQQWVLSTFKHSNGK